MSEAKQLLSIKIQMLDLRSVWGGGGARACSSDYILFCWWIFFLKKIIRPIKDILNLIEAKLKGSDRRWHFSLLSKLTLIKLCVLQQRITDSWPSRKVWTIGSGKSDWCISLQQAGLLKMPLRGSRHRDVVLQPVVSTTAKWEPRQAGLRGVRASGRQRLQWEWGSSQLPRDQPGIFLPPVWWRKAATWQRRSSMALARQLPNWVMREWRNAVGHRSSAYTRGACSLGEVSMKALHWLHVWGPSQTSHDEI